MSDQHLDQKPALTDPQVLDDTKIIPYAIGTTGQLYKATVAQQKKAYQTYRTKYVTTGSEGTTLTIPVIAGMFVLMIAREGQVMYEVSSSPDPAEFIWDGANITLGLTVNPAGGERFLILYKNN